MLSLLFLGGKDAQAQQEEEGFLHEVQTGDTWFALSMRYDLDRQLLQDHGGHINRLREPAIGSQIPIPRQENLVERRGRILHSAGGLLELATRYGVNPWQIVLINNLTHPFLPLLQRPLFLPDDDSIPREFPAGMDRLALSETPAFPGHALAFRAELFRPASFNASLDDLPFIVSMSGNRGIGLLGTGAFFPPGDHELRIFVDGGTAWYQPLRFIPGEWTYEQITLTGTAAQIDQQSIREEWERLSSIWSTTSPVVNWKDTFRLPLDSFLDFSSPYGAHRSYNGGPYSSYHEGTDFSAYGGTPVLAPAAGTVVLAEFLYVRGGAVLIDHGSGVYTGLYHMSEVLTAPGEQVAQGQVIGSVGSTGLSTGNHLHWDLLVGGEQVDALSWLQLDLPCWLLEGLAQNCPSTQSPA